MKQIVLCKLKYHTISHLMMVLYGADVIFLEQPDWIFEQVWFKHNAYIKLEKLFVPAHTNVIGLYCAA